MQIVIDIPGVFYEALKKTDEMVSGQRSEKTLMSVIYNAVANGTPLPKGHGRLIDADVLIRLYGLEDATKYGNETAEQQTHSYDTMMMYEIADMIDDAPTIIEANKAEGSGEE